MESLCGHSNSLSLNSISEESSEGNKSGESSAHLSHGAGSSDNESQSQSVARAKSFIDSTVRRLLVLVNRLRRGGARRAGNLQSEPTQLTFASVFRRTELQIQTSTDVTVASSEDQRSSRRPSLYQRLISLKGLSGFTLFGKQFGTPPTESASSSAPESDSDHQVSILVEFVKEGLVSYFRADSNATATGSLRFPQPEPEWVNCRLVLIKTIGGPLLEFYTPPQATRPKEGILCFLIQQARPSYDLKFPGAEGICTLRLKHTATKYFIDALNASSMTEWISVIHDAMNPQAIVPTIAPSYAIPSSESQDQGNYPLKGIPSPTSLVTSSFYPVARNMTSLIFVAILPLALARPNHLNHVQGQASGDDLPETTNSKARVYKFDQVGGMYSFLRQHPWYLGYLTKSAAAQLVLKYGVEGHGKFLVRPAGTQVDEFILTFNLNGVAKHMRFTISLQGHCRVGSFWFKSVDDMVEQLPFDSIRSDHSHSAATTDDSDTDYVSIQDFLDPVPSTFLPTKDQSQNNLQKPSPK